MNNENDKFRPINIFGYVISTLGITSLALAAIVPKPQWATQSNFIIGMIIWGGIEMLIWVIGGIGIVMRKIWGYYLLKATLYLFLIKFPIGTIIGYKMLSYIRDNNIKEYFILKYIEL